MKSISVAEIEFVDFIMYAGVLFVIGLAWSRWWPARAADEPLAAVACVPTILDAIFGGNRRERTLYPHRFTRQPVAAPATRS